MQLIIRKIFKDDKIVRRQGPTEWLGYLLNAKYVFTDSFHACAFCINCHKPFFVNISSHNEYMSNRIYNILDRYEMKDRLVKDEIQMFSIPDIDFSKSNLMIEKNREFALKYLRTALGIKQS